MSDLAVQTRPAPKAAGKLAALRAMIADRLGIPDSSAAISDAACGALLNHSDGERHVLSMLLTTVFFLAETDDLDRVDLPLIEQAIALQPAPGPAAIPIARGVSGVAASPPSAHRSTILAGGVAAFMLGAVGCLLVQAYLGPRPQAEIAARKLAANLAWPAAVARVAPPSVPPVPQQITRRPPPVPAGQEPAPAPLAAPAKQAQATIRPKLQLRFFMESPGAAPRARFIQQRLEAAGFSVVAIPDFWPRPPRVASLWYFHPGDEEIAQRAAQNALLLDHPPYMAARHGKRGPRPPPGTLELFVP